jgi:hypothetical protein
LIAEYRFQGLVAILVLAEVLNELRWCHIYEIILVN